MTNRIWIFLTLIALVAAYGFHHQVERTAPKYSGGLFP